MKRTTLHALGLCAFGLLSTTTALGQAATDVKCDGCVQSGDIATNGVRRADIQNFSINTPKLNNFAVTTEKIKTGAVTESKIAAAAVTESKISASAVSPEKLSSGLGNEGFLLGGVKISITTSFGQIRHGGYDLPSLYVTTPIETQQEVYDDLDFPSILTAAMTTNVDFGEEGNTQLSVGAGEDVLVNASATVSSDTDEFNPENLGTNVITGAISICYSTEGVVTWSGASGQDYQNITPVCVTSTGFNDQTGVATSYLFQNLPAGVYSFGLCAATANLGGCEEEQPDFIGGSASIAKPSPVGRTR